jgi:gliding motility-associated-like protein
MKKNPIYRIVMKSVMILTMCLAMQLDIYATHIAGAEIYYEHITGNKYKFKLKVYRDCKECKFNNVGGGDNTSSCNEVPNLLIKGAYVSNYSSSSFGSIDITRTSITDITNTCYTGVSKCRPSSNSQYGFELHQFEGVYDFSDLINQGYCQFDVSIGMSSRNININTQRSEQNFYNYAYINLCEGIINQSTEFSSWPQFIRPVNQVNCEALGIVNRDNDSLVFSLKPALVTRNIAVSYATNKNYNYPFDFYCSGVYPCQAKINQTIAEGFYCSPSTGDVIFTPTIANQGGVVVVECEEWKKNSNGQYYLAGVTRRDIYSEIINSNNNLPRFNNQLNYIQICEGEINQGIDIPLEDMQSLGSAPDTLIASIQSNLPNVQLIKKSINTAPYFSYSISFGNVQGYTGNNYVTIYVNDNHCNIRGSASKTYIVNVLKSKNFNFNRTVRNCGVLESSIANNNITSVYWTLMDANGIELKQDYSKRFSYQLPKGGKYIMKTYLPAEQGFCEHMKLDTFVVEEFSKPKLELGDEVTVCKGTDLEFNPIQLETYDNYKILVNGVLNSLPVKVRVDQNSNYIVKVLQENGCSVEDVKKVAIFPELSRNYKNDTICTNVVFPMRLKYPQLDTNKIQFLKLSSSSTDIILFNNGYQWNFQSNQLKPGLKNIQVKITDKNACEYNDSYTIQVLKPDSIDLRLPQTMCENSEPLQLPTRDKGVWKCDNQQSLIKNNFLSFIQSQSDTIHLTYTENRRCVNTKNYKILLIDTTPITFQYEDVMKICENLSPFELEASPAGGTWSGIHVTNNQYDASMGVGAINTITYSLTNIKGCVSKASFDIEVEKEPKIELTSSKQRICFGDVLGLEAQVDDASLNGYWFTDGAGQFENSGDLKTNYFPNQFDISMPILTFTYTVQTNNACGNVSSNIQVIVRDGQVGEIINNYPKEICEPAQIEFSTNYKRLERQEWYINDSLSEVFDYNFQFVPVLKAGEYVIKTKVRDSTCEAMSISQLIKVYPRPKVSFFSSPSGRISREYPRLYLKDQSYSKYGYRNVWYLNGDSISGNKEINYKIDVESDSFSIKLIAISYKQGCKDSMIQNFVFIPITQLFIPDAFSPDLKGPSENNSFKVYGPAMKVFNIEIFNKFGEKVFASDNMEDVWDGTYKGEMCMNGVYFYKVISEDFDGVSRDYSGTVTLIR